MIDGIIFDVDGTIWDATKISAGVWTKVMTDANVLKGPIEPEYLKTLFGKPMDIILSSMMPEVDPAVRNDIAEKQYVLLDKALRQAHLQPFDGIREAVSDLSKRYPLFVVSNCQSGYIECMLDCTELGAFFTDTLCYGDTNKYKAENIRTLMKKNDLSSPVYVGDTKGDEEASHSAGIRFAWAAYGYGQNVPHDFMINTPGDLRTLLSAENG